MPIQATVVLDSGCFLCMPEGNNGEFTEIGYFGSGNDAVSDICVLVDGNQNKDEPPINLGKNCGIEVRHVNANGKVKKPGVKGSPTFKDEILKMSDLYGSDMPVDPSKFDCVIHFDSGYFCGSLIKTRYFQEFKKQTNGRFAATADSKRKAVGKPIAHNVVVHFKLKKGEALELARNGEVFWSSKDSGAKERLDIEIVADNSTVEKFYRQVLQGKRDSYWLPNNGDPPPICPEPPCQP